MLKSVAKRLPHPLLMRLYHSYYLRGQATLACDLARVARLPFLVRVMNAGERVGTILHRAAGTPAADPVLAQIFERPAAPCRALQRSGTV